MISRSFLGHSIDSLYLAVASYWAIVFGLMYRALGEAPPGSGALYAFFGVLAAFAVVGTTLAVLWSPMALPVSVLGLVAPRLGLYVWTAHLPPYWLAHESWGWRIDPAMDEYGDYILLAADDEPHLVRRLRWAWWIVPGFSIVGIVASLAAVARLEMVKDRLPHSWLMLPFGAFGIVCLYHLYREQGGAFAKIAALREEGDSACPYLAEAIASGYALKGVRPRDQDPRWIAVFEELLLQDPLDFSLRYQAIRHLLDTDQPERLKVHRDCVLQLAPSFTRTDHVEAQEIWWWVAYSAESPEEMRRLWSMLVERDRSLRTAEAWLMAKVAAGEGDLAKAKALATKARRSYLFGVDRTYARCRFELDMLDHFRSSLDELGPEPSV
ncbi:hypothetical protein EON79_04205 [bacterium]|nr:MAG: hypothetical protein EON79_04205 [bacterium]